MVGTDNKNRHCDADRRKQSICRRLAALAESMDHRVASMMLLVMTMRRHECQYLHETAAPLSGLAVSILLYFQYNIKKQPRKEILAGCFLLYAIIKRCVQPPEPQPNAR